MQWVQSLGREDPLEKEMAIHSSILAWQIPWTEEPGYSPWGHKRVEHDSNWAQMWDFSLKKNYLHRSYCSYSSPVSHHILGTFPWRFIKTHHIHRVHHPMDEPYSNETLPYVEIASNFTLQWTSASTVLFLKNKLLEIDLPSQGMPTPILSIYTGQTFKKTLHKFKIEIQYIN